MSFATLFINNIDKIGAATAFMLVSIVLVYYLAKIFSGMTTVIDRISERAEAQALREDVFQTRLLDLHTKTVGNNDRIVNLLEAHEISAQERSLAQEERDQERLDISRQQTNVLSQITQHLAVVDETKNTVENIETTVIRTQGNVADLQTDIPALISRKAHETNSGLDAIKTALNRNYELVEKTLGNIQTQIVEINAHMQNGEDKNTQISTQMQSWSNTIEIVQTVVENNHKLLEALTKPPSPNLLMPTNEGTVSP